MNLRKTAVLVAPLAACLATSAHAAPPAKAPKPLVLTDATGDANAIADPGLTNPPLPLPESTSTPADLEQFDVKSLTIAATGTMASRKVGRKTVKYFNCTGYTATIETSGTPSTTASLYRVQAETQKLPQFWLQFNNPLGGTQRTTLRFTIPDPTLPGQTTTKTVDLANAAKVVENKIIFTVTAGDMKQAGEGLGKTTISGLVVDTRTHGNAVTVPMWDQLNAPDAAWKVCPA